MAENGTPHHPKHTDTHNHYPAVKCSRERHSLPFDAPGAIPFACMWHGLGHKSTETTRVAPPS